MTWLILIVWVLVQLSVANCEECTLKELENELYTPENMLNLTTVFFPVMDRTSRQIEVDYYFEGNDTIPDCTVRYFWATGGLLLIQPPQLLQFTSLLFSFPSNSFNEVVLTLPSKCHYLVYNETTAKCACQGEGDILLNILTHHLFQYAKYNSLEQVIRDENSAVRSVCSNNLDRFGGHKINYFLTYSLIVSFPVLVFFGIGINRSQKTIKRKFLDHNMDHNLFGLCLTAICVIAFVLAMDSTAAHFTWYSNEYKDTNFKSEFNLYVTYFTLVLDCFFVALYLPILFLCYKVLNKCKIRCFPCPYKSQHANNNPCDLDDLSNSHDKHGDGSKKTETTRLLPKSGSKILQLKIYDTKLVLFDLIFVAVACTSTHYGYILVSWLTEPKKTTCIALTSIAILLYLYLSFRAIYKLLFKGNKCQSECDYCKHISIVVISVLFITALPIMTVLAFWSLPVPALELAVYLENILEIILVLAAALISYKIFSFKQSDAFKFLKKFNKFFKDSNDTSQAAPLMTHSEGTKERSSVSDKASGENINCGSSDSEEETFEKSGEKVGKLCKIVQDNYTKEKRN